MSIGDYLPLDPAMLPVVIFCARVTDVSLGTLCMICTVRGYRLLPAVVSFVEILIWVCAVSSVLTHLDNPANVVAYAGGFAAGRALGMSVEGKLALGTQSLTFISRGGAQAVAERLRFADHCVTTLTGTGRDGPVAICHATLRRRPAPKAIRMGRGIDPDVVVTVEDVRATAGGCMTPYGAGKTRLPWRWLRRRYIVGNRATASLHCDGVASPATSIDDGHKPLPHAAQAISGDRSNSTAKEDMLLGAILG